MYQPCIGYDRSLETSKFLSLSPKGSNASPNAMVADTRILHSTFNFFRCVMRSHYSYLKLAYCSKRVPGAPRDP